MNCSSQGSEEEPSQGSDQISIQNESKLNELSQMMLDLKEEMFRLQNKNSCKINRVQDMLNGLCDTVKAKEEAAKQEAKSSPPHHTKDFQVPMAKSPETQQKEEHMAPMQKTAMSLDGSSPKSAPQPNTVPPMSSPPTVPPPSPQSMPPVSPPSPRSMPPPYYPPDNISPRNYSHGEPRRMPRHRRPDPANANILDAALRVVNELGFEELRNLKGHLRCQLSAYESRH